MASMWHQPGYVDGMMIIDLVLGSFLGVCRGKDKAL